MTEWIQVSVFLAQLLGSVALALVAIVAARVALGMAWDWFYNHVVRAALQVHCSVFIRSETAKRDYVGTFWLPSVPRIGEKLIVPEFTNPNDQKTHKMNGWLGGRVNKVEYAVEGGVPWHTNIHVDCEPVAVWE